jgi:HK97 gp10 family phage protein
MASDLKLTGLRETLKGLDATPKQILEKLKPVVRKHTAALEAAARSNAPVGDSGELAGSIKAEVVEGDDWIFGRVTADAPHAIHLEYGTVNNPAQPYLRPALQQQKGKFASDAKDAVKDL